MALLQMSLILSGIWPGRVELPAMAGEQEGMQGPLRLRLRTGMLSLLPHSEDQNKSPG